MFGSILGVLLVAAAAAWIWRVDLLRLTASRLLDRWGMGPVAMTVDSVDLTGLHARDISLFGGALRVEDLTLSYEPEQLIGGIVTRVTVTRPRLSLDLTGDGPVIGGMAFDDTMDASPTDEAPMGDFRIDAVRVIDGRIGARTATGPIEATFSSDLRVAGAAVEATTFNVDLLLADAGLGVRVTAPAFSLSPVDGGLRLRFSDVAIEPADLPWAAEAISGEMLWQSGRLTARLDASRVSSTQTPPLVTSFQVTGDASMDGPGIEFALRARADAPTGGPSVELEVSGRHELAGGKGTAEVALAPVVFRAGGLRPSDLFPGLADALPDLAGSVALSGSVAWSGSTITPNLVLGLANGVYEPKSARLSEVRGDIAISGLWPPATRPGQVIAATLEAGGLPPMRASLTFQLLPKPALRVETIRLSAIGGQISTSAFQIDPAQLAFDTVVALDQVDLSEFFRLVGVDGLSGSGRLGGTIPLRARQGAVIVRDGRLAASGPGVIRVDSGALPKQITQAGESMTLVLQALADFHYDSLTIDIAGEAAGDGTILVRLQGRNPGVLDGRAFHININFQSNFDRLIDIALRSMEATQALLRRTIGSARR